jgi:SAM-dependent methyltransferase
MKLNEKIVNAFACPDCSGDLICDLDRQSIHCVSCSSHYHFENNIPVLLLPDTREEFKKNIDEWGKNELVPHFLHYKYIQCLKSPAPFKWFGQKKVMKKICSHFKNDGIYIDIGGIGNIHPDVVNINISPSQGTDIVADGQKLPFKSNSIDGVFSLFVLEHVPHPEFIVKEMFRVLKPGGFIFVTVPFIQIMHNNPKDYSRFTPDGIRILFADFREEELEIASGPSGAMLWSLKEYLALLCPFSNYSFVYLSVREILGWVFYPLVFLDLFLKHKKRAEKMASSFYCFAFKE